MEDIKKLFGIRLKFLREKNGYTQEKFAELIDISSRALSAIECGHNFVTADTIGRICKVLCVNPKTLFDFDFQFKDKLDMKDELCYLINNNNDKLNALYRLIKAFLE